MGVARILDGRETAWHGGRRGAETTGLTRTHAVEGNVSECKLVRSQGIGLAMCLAGGASGQGLVAGGAVPRSNVWVNVFIVDWKARR